ncbi:MAG: hypothetical protein JWM80_2902, partial [Cyanobacteria bacterium RYN_339]|nr:hypothetical protein [Cyanobacteria bacterium RYN_339]
MDAKLVTTPVVQELTKVVPQAVSAPPPRRAKGKSPLPHVAAHVILMGMSLFSIFPVWWVLSMAFDANATQGVLRAFPAAPSLVAFQNVIAHPTEIDGLSFWQL